MVRRPYLVAVVVTVLSMGVAIVGSISLDRPIRDPDGVLGPSWVRLPLIVLVFFLADVVPRALRARRGGGVGLLEAAKQVKRQRWTRERLSLVGIGLGCFYVTYVAYRNLKDQLPFMRETVADPFLHDVDRTLMLGREPSAVLHYVLGTGFSAHALSLVYVSYLFFVPLTLAAALMWSRNVHRGFWYVTALCLNWSLGALSYYLVPSVGPRYANRDIVANLPETSVSTLQEYLERARLAVLADPSGTDVLHGIAGFASLHVSVVATALFFAIRAGLAPAVRLAALVYLVLTGLATIYFGWHYLLDDIAGLVIAYVAVRVGAWATGQGVPPTERLEAEEEPVGLPAATEAPLARQPGSRDTRSPVALGAGDSRPPRTHD
jgi:membrane-associated phospholipid phosphatase